MCPRYYWVFRVWGCWWFFFCFVFVSLFCFSGVVYLGFFFCLVWGFFCYVKKHGLKHQLPELNFLGKGEGLLVVSQFSALVPSHTNLKYEQSCKKLDLPNLKDCAGFSKAGISSKVVVNICCS